MPDLVDVLRDYQQAVYDQQTKRGRVSNDVKRKNAQYMSFMNIDVGDKVAYDVYNKHTTTKSRYVGTVTDVNETYIWINGHKFRIDKIDPLQMNGAKLAHLNATV